MRSREIITFATSHIPNFVIFTGGEGGIRTNVPLLSEKRFSRPSRSTTLAPLHVYNLTTFYIQINIAYPLRQFSKKNFCNMYLHSSARIFGMTSRR